MHFEKALKGLKQKLSTVSRPTFRLMWSMSVLAQMWHNLRMLSIKQL